MFMDICVFYLIGYKCQSVIFLLFCQIAFADTTYVDISRLTAMMLIEQRQPCTSEKDI